MIVEITDPLMALLVTLINGSEDIERESKKVLRILHRAFYGGNEKKNLSEKDISHILSYATSMEDYGYRLGQTCREFIDHIQDEEAAKRDPH